MVNIFIIDGDTLRDVTANTHNKDYPTVEDGRMEWYVYEDSDKAGEVARERWRDMAVNDPKEFTAIIGEKRIIGWALGNGDGYGCSSLEDFLDLTAQHPEEELASYDGHEHDARVNFTLASDLDLSPNTDGANLDVAILRKAIEDRDLETEAFPEDIQPLVEAFLAEPTDAGFAVIVDKILEDGGDEAEDIINDYSFMDVVAYRHN